MNNELKKAYMSVYPLASNHVVIRGRGKNFIDITTDPSNEDTMFILTSSKTYTLKKDGIIRCTHE